jgi:hypothetical protein
MTKTKTTTKETKTTKSDWQFTFWAKVGKKKARLKLQMLIEIALWR